MCSFAAQLLDFEAERNASEARDGLLQFESDRCVCAWTEIEGTAANNTSAA